MAVPQRPTTWPAEPAPHLVAQPPQAPPAVVPEASAKTVLPTKTTGITETEPVALAGAIQGVLSALLAVLVGFGAVHWTGQQIGLILGLYTAVSAAVQAFARGKVWSPASVAKLFGSE